MTDAFGNAHWKEVASLKPGLASHIEIRGHRRGNHCHYLLADPLHSRTLHLDTSGFLFISQLTGKTEVQEILSALNTMHGARSPSKTQVVQLIRLLRNNGFLKTPEGGDEKLPDMDNASHRATRTSATSSLAHYLLHLSHGIKAQLAAVFRRQSRRSKRDASATHRDRTTTGSTPGGRK